MQRNRCTIILKTVTPSVAVRKAEIGVGVFRHMLGAYRRNGIRESPKLRLITTRLKFVSNSGLPSTLLLRPPFSVINDRLLDRVHISVTLNSRKEDVVVERTAHPTSVLSECPRWKVQLIRLNSGKETSLTLRNKDVRRPVPVSRTLFSVVTNINRQNLLPPLPQFLSYGQVKA